MRKKENVCPCCGIYYFDETDFYEICEVCGWEDDSAQRENPDDEGGANSRSLNEFRKVWDKNCKRTIVKDYFEVALSFGITAAYDDLLKLKNLSPYRTYGVTEVIEAYGKKWYVINDDIEDGRLVAYKSDYFEVVEISEKDEELYGEYETNTNSDEREIANPEITQMCNDGILLHKAIEFSAYAHRKQTRKGSDKPYISHPFEVAMLLQKENCNIETVIAGLLHDTVEDADVTLEEIKEQFGERVCELVASCSEDKTKSWKERKEHTINEMMGCIDYDILMLCCADKTANLRSMMTDYLQIGDDLWKRFNAPREDILHYYSKLNDAFEPMLNNTNLYWENTRFYQTMFVKYYVDEEKKTMYQTNGEEAAVYDNIPNWSKFSLEEINALIKEYKLIPIKNEDAYQFEFLSWSGKIVNYYEYLEHLELGKSEDSQGDEDVCFTDKN